MTSGIEKKNEESQTKRHGAKNEEGMRASSTSHCIVYEKHHRNPSKETNRIKCNILKREVCRTLIYINS